MVVQAEGAAARPFKLMQTFPGQYITFFILKQHRPLLYLLYIFPVPTTCSYPQSNPDHDLCSCPLLTHLFVPHAAPCFVFPLVCLLVPAIAIHGIATGTLLYWQGLCYLDRNVVNNCTETVVSTCTENVGEFRVAADRLTVTAIVSESQQAGQTCDIDSFAG